MLLSWSDQEEEHHRRVNARPSSRRAGLLGLAGQFVSPVTVEYITEECLPQVLSAPGVYLRTAGVEAAEQIGRCERHGCIFKHNLSLVVDCVWYSRQSRNENGGGNMCLCEE